VNGVTQAPPLAIPAHDLEDVAALFHRLGLGRVVQPIPARVVWAFHVFLNGFITIALLARVAAITGVPFVFPSLGPTAYLLFLSPRAEAASPHADWARHRTGMRLRSVLGARDARPFSSFPRRSRLAQSRRRRRSPPPAR
jgi:hypothetical protein